MDFALACRDERDDMLANYANASGKSAVAILLAEANLSREQQGLIVSAIDTALTDAFYTVLLAIDGSASLGQAQQSFILTDGDGNMIANGDGRLEAAAWEVLQSDR
jgi:hypothetical protein